MAKVNPVKELERQLYEISELLDKELENMEEPPVTMRTLTRKRTICDVFREIYMKTESDEVKKLSLEGSIIAKKMARRLIMYRKTSLVEKVEPELWAGAGVEEKFQKNIPSSKEGKRKKSVK